MALMAVALAADEKGMHPPETDLAPEKTATRSALLPIRLVFLSVFWVVFAAPPPRVAAQTTSTLQGTVSDPQRLAIVGATITLSGPTLANDIEITSDAVGAISHPWIASRNLQLAGG